MRILHLIIDHQVIERTLGIYERLYPKSNDVLIFSSSEQKGIFKHLTTHKNCEVILWGKGSESGKVFNFHNYSHIIAHYLTLDMVDFIEQAPSTIDVTWEVYGWDLYNQFQKQLNYEITYTNAAPYIKYGYLKEYFPFLYDLLYCLKGHHIVFNFQIEKKFKFICSRLNAIQHGCSFDAKLIQQYGKRNILSYEVFNYSLKEVLGDLYGKAFSTGESILIGNSASFSNNHLYCLKHLKNRLSTNTSLIIPLSYGGSLRYAEMVQSRFTKDFGANVEVIKEYMPLHEYNKIFLNIKTMVMSAWRQESVGTIIMGLYLGIKVVLSKKGPLYEWFKEKGFVVYPLEELSYDINVGLTLGEQTYNRSRLLECYDIRIFEGNIKQHIK